MESPATADEADDSYRTLGVGGSAVASFTSKHPVTNGRRTSRVGRRRYVRVFLEGLMRELWADTGFTISVLVAVAITAGFAFIFEAPLELVTIMLVMGLVTAILEHVMQQQQPP